MKKVNFLCLILLGVFFSSCDTDDDPWGDWEKSNEYPGDYRVLAVSFQDGENVYVGMGYNQGLKTADKYLANFYKFDGSTWTTVTEKFPDDGRQGCVAFVIGDTAYVGAGFRAKYKSVDVADIYYSDFYKFVLSKGEWAKDASGKHLNTDIADFVSGDDIVSSKFWGGIGFELKGKGYVGTGNVDGRTSKSIFSFDPATGVWTASALPDSPRAGAVVFKIRDVAIVCLGVNGRSPNFGVLAFDGSTWKEQEPLVDVVGDYNNNYGEIPRSYGVAFTLDADFGLCGYIAGGSTKTVWRYNLEMDRWHEVEELSRVMNPRVGAIGFTIGNIGYITTGGSSTGSADNNSTWLFKPGIDEDDSNDYN